MIAVALFLGLCILLEAFFSGAEIALVSADKVKLRVLAEETPGRRGQLISDFVDDPTSLISTSLVGTNICVVLSTVVATLTFMRWYPGQAELLSLAVMAPLVLIFGEIVPKSLFQNYADQVAPRAIFLLWLCRFLFYPFVAAGTALSNLLFRALGLDQEESLQISRKELRLLIRLPSAEGEDRITPDERKMVTRLFDFRETTVEQVMVRLSEVVALPVDASPADLAREIADRRHTRIPVYEERLDNIVGIIHSFDLLRAEPGGATRDLYRPAIYVPEGQPVMNTLMRLKREGQGMAVVVDEYGGATGVITIEDIVEEVVGEIEDEYDLADRDVIFPESAGVYRVAGRATIERVNNALKLDLPLGEEYESVAGLILDQLKRIPKVGEEVVVGGVRLVISKASERAIDEVRIRLGFKAKGKKA